MDNNINNNTNGEQLSETNNNISNVTSMTNANDSVVESTPTTVTAPVVDTVVKTSTKGGSKLLIGIIAGVVVIVGGIVIGTKVLSGSGNSSSNSETGGLYKDNTYYPRYEEDGDKAFYYLETTGKKKLEGKCTKGTFFFDGVAQCTTDDNVLYINKNGDELLKLDRMDYSYNFNETQRVWLIEDSLYDTNMKKISRDDMKVRPSDSLRDNKYYYFNTSKSVGVIDYQGNILFEKDVEDGENSSLWIKFSNFEKDWTQYGLLTTKDDYQIFNCTTSKTVKTIPKDGIEYVVPDLHNEFHVSYESEDGRYGSGNTIVYLVVDDDIILEADRSKGQSIDAYIGSKGSIWLKDAEGKKHYDYCGKQFIDNSGDGTCNFREKDETFFRYPEYTFDEYNHKILKGDTEVISFKEYTDFVPFKSDVLSFLRANGKNLVIAAHSSGRSTEEKIFDIVDLNEGKVIDTVTTYYSMSETFGYSIIVKEYKDGKRYAHNILNGKTSDFELTIYDVFGTDYVAHRNDDGKYDFYNGIFEKFQTRPYTGDRKTKD